MTTEYEKHWRSLSGIRRRAIPRLSNDMFNSSSQSRVFPVAAANHEGLAVACGTSADSASGSTRDSAERQILHSLQILTDPAPLLADPELIFQAISA
jgi:hypothetical protein